MVNAASPKSIAVKLTLVVGALFLAGIAAVLAYDASAAHGLPAGKAMKAMVLFLMSAAAAAFFYQSCRHILVRPLSRLEAAMAAAGDGRLAPVEAGQAGGELESLALGFNRMVESLSDTRRQTGDHHSQLEKESRCRTDELEQALQRAMAAARAKNEFLATVSHEMRTPMSGVIGMLELVLESPLNAEQTEHLTAARSCAQSLLALLNELLDLSKLEAGRMALEEIPYEPRPLLAECVSTYRAKAQSNGVSVVWAVDAEVPRLLVGDPLRLRQILSNLLSNAVKFTAHGTIRAEVKLEPGGPDGSECRWLALQVSDTGSGISPEKQDSIFDEFTQADCSISRRYGGSGLGLAIVKKLTELHGGRIQLQSEPGKGSCFTVLLPVAVSNNNAPSSAMSPASLQAAEAAERGPILLVEDNLINQKVVTSLLRKKGYHVDVANHGQEALDLLARQSYQLVLMDVQMPVLDGLEATHRIRSNPRLACLPIIAMTAHAMNGDRERCLAAGMNEYLAKPVDHKQLLALVEEYLSRQEPPAPPLSESQAAAPAPATPAPASANLEAVTRSLSNLEEETRRARETAPDRAAS